MKLTPLHDRILVIPLAKETQTTSGLLLPDTGKHERPDQGEVVAIGPGKLNDAGVRIPPSVSIGDKILFKKYAPDEVTIAGKEYLVIADSDIIAIFN